MGLSEKQADAIKGIIRTSIRLKLKNHNPEPAAMPFHVRLLGSERLAYYSFIHSLSTNFGTSIFEPIAVAIAEEHFTAVEKQVKVGVRISSKAQEVIQEIMDSLSIKTSQSNKAEEIKRIREVCGSGDMKKIKKTKVDLKFETEEGAIMLIDLKTAKPNKDGFIQMKRTLLEWVAVILADAPDTDLNTMIAIPYNPYDPEPYDRWTLVNMFDKEHELKVGRDFWDFLAQKKIYDDLLECFEKVGDELKNEIDEYFRRFRS